MGMTRANILDRVVAIIGDNSTEFRSYLETSLDNAMHLLWDAHDWTFKHKASTLSTVIAQEEYDLSVVTTDIRSSNDIEVLYDSTEGRFLRKNDLHSIKKRYPKADNSGDPTEYAPWGTKAIFLNPIPDAVNALKFLYIAKCTVPTADVDDLEDDCGLPDYVQPILEKLLLSEGFLYTDDARRSNLLSEINSIYIPNAIVADMKHLDSCARIKFWEEELAPRGVSYDDFLKHIWWDEN